MFTNPKPMAGKEKSASLLQITDLTVDFDLPTGWVRCLHGIHLEVYPGGILGLVGESGCGKSVTCMAVMQLLGPRALIRGRVQFEGRDLLALDEKALTQLRGRDIAMIFQDPVSSLNPVHTIGRQVVESIRYNTTPSTPNESFATDMQGSPAVAPPNRLKRRAAHTEAARLLTRIDIPEAQRRLKEYPHQLSGGMNQRAMIAMALAGRPKLLIADEPTTALDVTIQAQILEIIRELRRELGMSIILVTHDLGVVAETCDRMAVMYCGRIVEEGPVQPMFADPRHPYTRGLLAALPRIDRRSAELYAITGSVPAPHEMPPGCAFEPRCPVSLGECRDRSPVLETDADGRRIACANPQRGGL